MKKIFFLAAATVFALASCDNPDVRIGWMDTDVRFGIDEYPEALVPEAFSTPVWKNDKASAELVVWSGKDIGSVEVRASDLRRGFRRISADNICIGAVRYVKSDFKEKYVGSREEKEAARERNDSTMVADIIDLVSETAVPGGRPQPFWISVKVPSDAAAGVYSGKVTVKGKGLRRTLSVKLEIADRTLADPHDWHFHLDLWQNPYSVAAYHNVPLWSEEHFNLMRPLMTLLADAGQKVVTATIIDRPWNGQTHVPFGSMVKKTLRRDGTWSYDYDIFDKWVRFMMDEVGIDAQINCYSLIPWSLTFDYFDEESGADATFTSSPTEKEYEKYWGSFLADFEKHVAQNGWLGKTYIAMDERPRKMMDAAMDIIEKYSPGLKVSLAGFVSDSFQDSIDDLCLAYGLKFPGGAADTRRSEGKISTFYTCCSPIYPNTFPLSTAAESTWMGWYAAATGLDGYLRWAYNSWNENPLEDTRYNERGHFWMAGDCFLVYPDARSSIRFEKLAEGIRYYEKIRILREGASDEDRARIDSILSTITSESLDWSEGAAASKILSHATWRLAKLY